MNQPTTLRIKRTFTWIALCSLTLSIGFMLYGWIVANRAAFELGVFGYKLFPFAIGLILLRLLMMIIFTPAVVQYCAQIYLRFTNSVTTRTKRPKITKSNTQEPMAKNHHRLKSKDVNTTYLEHMMYFHYPATGKDILGTTIEENEQTVGNNDNDFDTL